jgi:hypothetical protein
LPDDVSSQKPKHAASNKPDTNVIAIDGLYFLFAKETVEHRAYDITQHKQMAAL